MNQAIADLPSAPSSEPSVELNSICTGFTAELSRYTQGSPEHEDLVQDVMQVFKRFKLSIRDTAPRFIPFSSKESMKGSAYAEPGFLDEGLELPRGNGLTTTYLTANLDDVRKHIQKYVFSFI